MPYYVIVKSSQKMISKRWSWGVRNIQIDIVNVFSNTIITEDFTSLIDSYWWFHCHSRHAIFLHSTCISIDCTFMVDQGRFLDLREYFSLVNYLSFYPIRWLCLGKFWWKSRYYFPWSDFSEPGTLGSWKFPNTSN